MIFEGPFQPNHSMVLWFYETHADRISSWESGDLGSTSVSYTHGEQLQPEV